MVISMSSLTRLVQQRKDRIQFMRDLVKKDCKKWSSKRRFLAMYMINTGVRKRLALEYYQIILDFGDIEEKRDGNEIMFRVYNDEGQD